MQPAGQGDDDRAGGCPGHDCMSAHGGTRFTRNGFARPGAVVCVYLCGWGTLCSAAPTRSSDVWPTFVCCIKLAVGVSAQGDDEVAALIQKWDAEEKEREALRKAATAAQLAVRRLAKPDTPALLSLSASSSPMTLCRPAL